MTDKNKFTSRCRVCGVVMRHNFKGHPVMSHAKCERAVIKALHAKKG